MCGIWGLLQFHPESTEGIHDKFNKIKHRGPDRSRFLELNEFKKIFLGFHRLAIMDKYTNGDQPFVLEWKNRSIYCLTNGEIYNYKDLVQKFDLKVKSKSDCEVIPLIYEKFGVEGVVKHIRGEFAITIFDICHETQKIDIHIIRDPFGIRPLFYQFDGFYLSFCSEMKGLVGIYKDELIQHFPPGKMLHIEVQQDSVKHELKTYFDVTSFAPNFVDQLDSKYTDETLVEIRKQLEHSVISMLDTDRPLGALLSGGLDSSLVVGIAAKHLKHRGKRLRTFSIGIPGSTDKEYAEAVAKYCDTDHTHIEFTNDQFLNSIEDVVWATETYDTTTIRASTGQLLVSRWISQNTDIKVLLIGDGSDELTAGYMYFHNAPSPTDLHYENCRLLKEIHMYDVLRADRGIASNGLEARVPYLDVDFVSLYLTIDPRLRMPTYGHEKWLLRKAFDKTETIPDCVLWRRKEAFSDGVSGEENSWYKILQTQIEEKFSDSELKLYQTAFPYLPPQTKEGLYFRRLFCNMFTDDTSHILPHYWLPRWCGDVHEPSARILDVYKQDKCNVLEANP